MATYEGAVEMFMHIRICWPDYPVRLSYGPDRLYLHDKMDGV
jgi:hypothetical protein